MENMNTKELSSTPMIMGIVGFVAAIPGSLCSLFCAGSADALTMAASEGKHGGSFTALWIVFSLLPTIGGLVAGFMAKSNTKLWGWLLILFAGMCLVGAIITLNWLWGLITVACFAIGGAVSLSHK
jgi:hypothetical protein